MRIASAPDGRLQCRRMAAFGTVVAALALASCSATGPRAGSSTSLTVPIRNTTTTTTLPGPTSTLATVTTTTSTVRPPDTSTSTTDTTTHIVQTLNCTTANLSISVGGGQSGLSHFGYVILFENKGPDCFLHGYPVLDGEDANGAIVEAANQTPSGNLGGLGFGVSEPTFILETGQTASAFYEGLGSGLPGGSCAPYTVLVVTPPNETQSAQVLSPQQICQLQVHPVVPGSTGDDPPLP